MIRHLKVVENFRQDEVEDIMSSRIGVVIRESIRSG